MAAKYKIVSKPRTVFGTSGYVIYERVLRYFWFRFGPPAFRSVAEAEKYLSENTPKFTKTATFAYYNSSGKRISDQEM